MAESGMAIAMSGVVCSENESSRLLFDQVHGNSQRSKRDVIV